MKKIFITISLLILPLLLFSQIRQGGRNRIHTSSHLVAAIPIWDNLISWWTMDGTSGICEDSSPTGDHGGNYSPTEGATGAVGDAYTFNGDTVIIDGTAHGTATLTYAFRCKPNGDSDCDLLGGAVNSFKIQMYPDYKIRVLKAGGAGTGVTAAALTNGAWNFVSVTRDGSTFRIGINGTYENFTWSGQDFTGITNWIGHSSYGSNAFIGDLDEVVLFSDVKNDTYLDDIRTNLKTYTDGQ